MSQATVTIERSGGGAVVSLAGSLVVGGVDAVRRRARGRRRARARSWSNSSRLDALDTAGAWAILDLRRRLAAEGVEMRLEGASDPRRALLDTVEKSMPSEAAPPQPRRSFVDWVAGIGEATVAAGVVFREIARAPGRRGGEHRRPDRCGPGGCGSPRWSPTCRRPG